MKIRCNILHLFYALLLLSNLSLYSHGFGCFTYVKSQQGWNLAGQIEKDRFVASYDVDRGQLVSSSVKAAGYSQTNCYFRIGFEGTRSDDIQCTPDQVFYVPECDAWVPACELNVGDELLSADGSFFSIIFIEFVQKPLNVFTFEVEDTHTFFVGSKSVLVHNMLAPFSFVGLSLAFGSGATAGGAGGSFLGPITLVGGVVIGGIVGAAIYGCTSKGTFKYQLDYKPEAITTYLQMRQDQFINDQLYNGAKDSDNDAQAPGKPTEKDGYVPPKKWDGKKVKVEKGKLKGKYGYPDAKGRVWVPTGPVGHPLAHGGPHWDVADQAGRNHENILPGGKKR